MSREESGEKSFEPTPRKLEEARRKGEVPRSVDVITAAAYGGVLLAAASFGGAGMLAVGGALSTLLAAPDQLAGDWFGGGSTALGGAIGGRLVGALLPWFILPAAAAFLAILAQQSLVFAPSKIAPRLSRISPLETAKQKFGRNGLFEFFKSFVKLAVYSLLLGLFLLARMDDVMATVSLSPRAAIAALLRLGFDFLVIALLIAAAIAAIDLLWQRAEHRRRHMMTRQEVLDETKESEGDPHLKQARRQRGQEIAMNRMLADVPDADVVIVNPAHYAVALAWSRAPGDAPVCVAKGVDEIAARIREAAQAAGVPIHRDPPTARAIWRVVEIGQQIRPEHYRAVAAAIRFAETLRAQALRR